MGSTSNVEEVTTAKPFKLKRLAAAALGMLSLTLSWGAGAATDGTETVRVKLLRLSLPLHVHGTSLQVTDLKKDEIENVSLPKAEEDVTVDQRLVDGEKIWIIKKGDRVVRSNKPVLEIQSMTNRLKVSGYDVPAPLLLSTHNSRKNVDVIAALKLDDYLEGVLAGEMPASWPLEALKAQAVAARTYTLYQLENHKDEPFQLEGSVLDQVYSSSQSEIQKDKVHQAVQETEGMILKQNGRVFKAYYHSDCGGQTEDPAVVWGGKTAGKAAAIIDTQCAFSPSGKWTLEMTREELKDKLTELAEKISDIKSLTVVSRTPSQRVSLLALNDGEKDVMISGNDLRRYLGYNKLKSTLFTLTQKDDGYVFFGRGFGHGSGLCQWGARFMAQKGKKFSEILKHYYPTARLDLPIAAD